jgi:RNA polymerase sigma-70 factor (ECF subfamily)
MTAATPARPTAFCALGGARLSALTHLRPAKASQRLSPNDQDSDQALMARVAAGERAAIRVLMERHQLKIYRFVLRLVDNSATAEDIVSEVFLELWRHAAKFEGRAQLSTWILAIARNKAMSMLRGRSDEALDDAAAEQIPDRTADPDAVMDEGRRSATLRACIDRLPPAQREIIDLAYYHEKSVEEVAAIVGIPPATVKTRMFYARKRLAECLREAGVESAVA